MLRAGLLAVLVYGCAASTLVGAAVTTGTAASLSAAQRKLGGCYATCTGGTICNPKSGLCEKPPPLEHRCGDGSFDGKCAPGEPSDVTSAAPGTQKTIQVLQPVPMPSGPPQIVPAAEQNPPSHK